MSGVPLEICWAFNKLWNNKFYYKLYLVGISIESCNFVCSGSILLNTVTGWNGVTTGRCRESEAFKTGSSRQREMRNEWLHNYIADKILLGRPNGGWDGMDIQQAFLQILNRKVNQQNGANWNILARYGSGCKQSTGLQVAVKDAEFFWSGK